MSQDEPRPAPPLDFTFAPALESFNIPMKTWLDTNDKHFNGLHTSALVYSDSGRVLLVKRAPHDSMPNRWESPGGAVDESDKSILYGCARELWEEAGLKAKKFVRVVPASGVGTPFTNRNGTKVFYRFTFEVEVEDTSEITLDPNEHTEWLWATEDEVTNEKAKDDQDLPISAKITKTALLEGFKARRDES